MTETLLPGTRKVGCDLGPLRLILIETQEAMDAICVGTKWFVKPNVFESYQERGNVYVVLKEGAPYAFVQDASVAQDVNENEISSEIAVEIAPLFRNVVISKFAFAAASNELDAASNRARRESTLAQVKVCFVHERMLGYKDSGGHFHIPILQEEAEALWAKGEHAFRKAVRCIGHTGCFVDDGLINLARVLNSMRGESPRHLVL